MKILNTRKGTLRFPTYLPVTTVGSVYPLDALIAPYLPRLAQAVMVSVPFTQRDTKIDFPLPLFLDSGGFLALREGSFITERSRQGIIHWSENGTERTLSPYEVIERQETLAEVAFTLDFPIPSSLAASDPEEARRRQRLTISNAFWMKDNRRRRDLPIYACVQGWDEASYRECARAYVGGGFEGIAIGGMVPLSGKPEQVLSIVRAVREEVGDSLLHVLGIGHPHVVSRLFEATVDSVDSSSYVRLAVDGKLWGKPEAQIPEPSPTDRLHLALCNLALATGATLPLSFAHLFFETAHLATRADGATKPEETRIRSSGQQWR